MGLAIDLQYRDFLGILERERGILENIQLLNFNTDVVSPMRLLEFTNDLGNYAIGILA